MSYSNNPSNKPLRSLFPSKVITIESKIKDVEGSLYPEEAKIIKNAGEKRKQEFTAGRMCARLALEELGFTNFPLLIGHDRNPLWPEGIIGSISHTELYCGVAVAKKKDYQSIGIDMELTDRLGKQLWPQIFTPREQSWIQNSPDHEHVSWASLFFSAKECFYKYQFPLTNQWVGFEDAEIKVDVEEGKFNLFLLKDISSLGNIGSSYAGYYRYYDDHIITVIY